MSNQQTEPTGPRIRYVGTSFLKSLKIQRRVIGAVLLREILTRYGRHNIGFLWLFIEPMLFAVGMTILWTYMRLAKGDIPIAGFALTGYSAIVMWRNTVNRMTNTASSNKGLLYHHQVKILDLAIARLLLEFSGVTTSLVILTIAFSQLGLMALPADPLSAVLGWFYLMWFVSGAGLVATYLGEISVLFDRVWHVLMYLTLPFTGAFYMVAWLPPEVQSILLWSPMVNAVEMLRGGYFGSSVQPIYSVEYMCLANSTITLIGLVLVRKVRRRTDEE
jgi:capsular polysaccharide transport system permease protein